MNEFFRSIIPESTGASSLMEQEVIQELWSGYGKIMRVRLEDASTLMPLRKQSYCAWKKTSFKNSMRKSRNLRDLAE